MRRAKNGVLGKFFARKSLNLDSLQVVEFDKISYTQLQTPAAQNEHLEEVLFDRACEELGIAKGFDYAMSYVLGGGKAFVFLALDEILDDECELSFAEPLLWQGLNKLNALKKAQISERYAVLVLQKSYGYAAFYDNNELLALKNLPLFSLDYLQNKDRAALQGFLNERIYPNLKMLCENHKSQMLIFVGDELNFGDFLAQKLEISSLDLDKFTQKPHLKPREWASFLQNRVLKEGNFLRHKTQSTLPKRLALGFCACFVLGFCFVLAEFLLERNALKRSFEGDLSLPNFSSLQQKSSANALQIEQKRETLAIIAQELTPTPLLERLETLFSLLYENKIELESVEFTPSEIKILIPLDDTSTNFVKSLYASDSFTLKNKELLGEFYELILERK